MPFDPISAVLDIGGKLIDRLWPDPTEKAKAQLALLQLQQQGELQAITQQLEVDKVEASSASLFVAGWRPFIGWVCGTGLAYQFVAAPLFTWIAALAGHPIPAPALDLGTLMTLLFGMLGLGSMRTVEKINGINAGH